MPIGQDSITKRVAKIETSEQATVVETAPASDVKAETKKPAEKKSSASTKKPAQTVLANVAPETVEAVVGHKENKEVKKDF